eukprot:6576884-Karenia_brevis.AAC.1
MKGTPWQPVPGRRNNKIPTQIGDDSQENQEGENIEEEEDQEFRVQVEIDEDESTPKQKRPEFEESKSEIRDMYVRKDDIKDFGPTPGCN